MQSRDEQKDHLDNIDLLHVCPLLLHLRHCDNEDSVLQFRRDGIAVNLLLLIASKGRKLNRALENAYLSLSLHKAAQERLVARSVYNTGDIEIAFLGIVVDANVFLACAWESDVQDVCGCGCEDVDRWGEGIRLVIGIGRSSVAGGVAAKARLCGISPERLSDRVG
jgi:hypothetical protein